MFVYEGVKVKWELEVTTSYAGTETYLNTIEDMVLDGLWSKIVRYDIYYTNPATGSEVLLFSNQNGGDSEDLRYQIHIGTDRKGAMAIEMIAPVTAYYNIRLYRPVGIAFNIKTDKVQIDKVQATVLDSFNEAVYTDVIKSFYSQSVEETITMHDDIRDIPNMIRLSKLGEVGDIYDTITYFDVEVLSTDTAKMIQLTLGGLKTVLAHKNNITVGGEPLRIIGYEYNYLGSNEFYVIYDEVAFGREVESGENVVVSLRKYALLPDNINDWTSWADDVYQVSYKRYASAAVEVLRNLYTKSHPLLYATMQGFLSPREFVNFNYQGDKVWYPLDVEWRLDEAETIIVASQNFYGQAVTENLPPSVNAGVDISLAAGVFATTLTATASDPDGTIVSVLWEWMDPSGAAPVIVSPTELITNLTGLTGDEYVFRVTVTDNVGLTASDTVTVARTSNYTLVLTYQVDSFIEDTFQQVQQKQALLSIVPALSADQTARITINSVMVRETPADIGGLQPTNLFTVTNNTLVAHYINQIGLRSAVFLYRNGNVSQLNILAKAFNSASDALYPDNTNKVFAKVQADITAEIITGKPGVITNVPIQLIVEAIK